MRDNIIIQTSAEELIDKLPLRKHKNPPSKSSKPEKHTQELDKDTWIFSTEEDLTPSLNEEEELDKVGDTVCGGQFDSRAGYGAIQEHLDRLEDRHRRLSNCMCPPGDIMAMASDGEDRDYNSNGRLTPNNMTRSEGFGEQLLQLHMLVQEMKDGFVLAMQELGRIQDGDKELTDRVENSERKNQQMISELTNSVEQLKMNLSTTLKEMKKNSEMTTSLSEQVHKLQNDKTQLLEEMKQQGATRKERSKNKRKTSPQSPHSDSDNNNSDSGKPQSNPDSSKSDWEATRKAKRMSPMLQPFMDSLPDGTAGNMSPPCDSDSDSSATKAANRMLRMGNTLREKYQRREALPASSDSDDPHDILAQLPDGKEGGTLTREDVENASANTGQRLQEAQELLSSERVYVSQLRFLKENIVNPLIAANMLTLSDINMLFPPCLNKLYQKHCTLLSTLESRLSHWKYQGMLGDIFARLTNSDEGEFLQLYSRYIQNFSSSLSALSKQTNKSTRFQAFLKAQLSSCSKEESDLTVYLLAPVQRIPSYVLCLKKLLKCTKSAHPDYFHIESSLKLLNDFIYSVNALVDSHGDPIRKASLSSQSSTEMVSSKKSSSRDSGVFSPDEYGNSANFIALQRTWQDSLRNTGSRTSNKLVSSRSKSEQKDSTNKTGDKSDRTSHKTRAKTKLRPKLERQHSQMQSSSPPWGYDPQFMYNQQQTGVYSSPQSMQPMPPMIGNGPAYVYGHPNHQMMAYDGQIMAATAPYGQHSASRRTGTSNVKYMMGRGFDPRVYGQVRSASMDEFGSDRQKVPVPLDFFAEEDEGQPSEKDDTEGTADSSSTYVPSTPTNAVSRTKQMKNNKERTRSSEDEPSSPIRDAPSPVYDDPIMNSASMRQAGADISPGKIRHKMQRSQTHGEPVQNNYTPREVLRRKKSLKSVSPTPSVPVLLTDVWNDGTPTEIDRVMERRISMQDNRRAMLQSFQELQEKVEDKTTKKTSISSSFKKMFKRRNLYDAPIDEEPSSSEYSWDAYNAAPPHVKKSHHHHHRTRSSTPIPMNVGEHATSKSVTVSSIVGIQEDDENNLSSFSHLKNKRRSSAAAVLSSTYDENGDPCSAV